MFSVIDATLGGDLAKQSQRKRIYEERAFDPEIGEMHPRLSTTKAVIQRPTPDGIYHE
jgi:hypothetical protein